ncbi:solute carrier organic anion transporter family member 4C1-like [Hydractinia symbiolongicarpus]|uniref:solute carrier organic anion transporter family member 4C1-like n=1 Tax=Hydractinia symbiolongicarpus TaxID=13093 RepID=UPI00254FF35A|nr:solute carrier organic anion transporter family member 4C1-like [Hydractinia symbiolongicarpus]
MVCESVSGESLVEKGDIIAKMCSNVTQAFDKDKKFNVKQALLNNSTIERRPSEVKYRGVENITSRYGWGKFTPNSLQRFNNTRSFLVFICVCTFGQGMVSIGMISTFLTTLEKRYEFKSTEVALLTTFADITAAIFCCSICYYGHRHRPRAIAFGFITLIFGIVITTIPQFISPPYEVGVERVTDACQARNTTGENSECQQRIDNQIYLFIFIIGGSIMALGPVPLYGLGFAHIDETTDRGQNSLYIGIMEAFSALGPAAGFMLGKPILNIYVDIKQVSAT